jgi:DNA mismatch repair ATPase MutS
MILSFATAIHIHGEFNRALVADQAFARYADLFAHAVRAPGDAPLLGAVRTRLASSGAAASECLRQLNRILGFAQLRAGAAIFHFPIQALTLWDFHVFFALDAWRRRVGSSVRGWMNAVGELDALSALAQVRADNPGWALPEVVDARTDTVKQIRASNLGHPLIPDDRRVGNDVEVGPPGTVLITGSNMSGKSTLLRAIGVNAVLAQAGGPVCAAALRVPAADLETSIRVQDSLEHGLSYFMAALARLKGVLDRARHRDDGRIVLYLLDEILQGTNTGERAIAVRGVARHLLKAGAIGAMTTHDLGLAAEEPLNTAGRLAHFTELVDEHGAMTFDYRLRPGLATSRNALRLMRFIGIEE